MAMRHTESVWATENGIVEFVEWMHSDIAERSACALILDVYDSHRTDRVIATAGVNEVGLLFVLVGGTGRFQPMHRRIFEDPKAQKCVRCRPAKGFIIKTLCIEPSIG
jgi:hypothetical protein